MNMNKIMKRMMMIINKNSWYVVFIEKLN